MTVHKQTIEVTSTGGAPTYIDVTTQVREAVRASGVGEGIVVVMSPHTTCAVFFEEFVHDKLEDGTEFLQADLNDALARIFPNQTAMPPAGEYRYPGPEHFTEVEKWPDAAVYLPGGERSALLNADAHLKATLIGSSQTFEVAGGELAMGVTGYIYFVDFDRSRGRNRRCRVVVMGE